MDCYDRHADSPSLPHEKQLLITIWFLSNQETIRSIADRIGVCYAIVHHSVRKIMVAIKEILMPILVTWPRGE